MQVYTRFAEVYDIFMDNVPYEDWTEYLVSLLKDYHVTEGLVLELACGTGAVTRCLSAKGYDMIGLDNSEEMLEIARGQEICSCEEENSLLSSILYLNQDMREFELYGTVSAIVCICDGMNYLTEEEELKKVFRLANNYLEESGVFIFDLNTLYKYRDLLGDTTIAETREDCSFIWENYFDQNTAINEYHLTIFKKLGQTDKKNSDLYERMEEYHYQRAYELETVKRCIEEAGMEFVTAWNAFSREAPDEKSERIYIVAREQHNKGKLYL